MNYIFIPFLIIQFLLPLRHHLIEGNVFWTEEAHRHSWRMMLRTKSGSTQFTVIDKETQEIIKYNAYEKLTPKQFGTLHVKPEAIWQMANRIHQEFAEDGRDVAVYARSKVSLNRGPRLDLIDHEVDLSQVKYKWWKHNDWILLHPDDKVFGKK